jgi:hypothetical protein
MNSRLLRSVLCVVCLSSAGVGVAFGEERQGTHEVKREQIDADSRQALSPLYARARGAGRGG